MSPLLREARDAEMPALKSAWPRWRASTFPSGRRRWPSSARRSRSSPRCTRSRGRAHEQPKAERRAGLAQEYFDEITALIELLDKLSMQLTNSVKLEDAFIDQLMQIKQLAWLTRNAGGDSPS